MGSILDPKTSRKFDPDGPEVVDFVERLEIEKYNFSRHYLAWLALDMR